MSKFAQISLIVKFSKFSEICTILTNLLIGVIVAKYFDISYKFNYSFDCDWLAAHGFCPAWVRFKFCNLFRPLFGAKSTPNLNNSNSNTQENCEHEWFDVIDHVNDIDTRGMPQLIAIPVDDEQPCERTTVSEGGATTVASRSSVHASDSPDSFPTVTGPTSRQQDDLVPTDATTTPSRPDGRCCVGHDQRLGGNTGSREHVAASTSDAVGNGVDTCGTHDHHITHTDREQSVCPIDTSVPMNTILGREPESGCICANTQPASAGGASSRTRRSQRGKPQAHTRRSAKRHLGRRPRVVTDSEQSFGVRTFQLLGGLIAAFLVHAFCCIAQGMVTWDSSHNTQSTRAKPHGTGPYSGVYGRLLAQHSAAQYDYHDTIFMTGAVKCIGDGLVPF